MNEKKYRLIGDFIKENLRNFPVHRMMDKIVTNDEMPKAIEMFTQGYSNNMNWHSLKITVEDVTGI